MFSFGHCPKRGGGGHRFSHKQALTKKTKNLHTKNYQTIKQTSEGDRFLREQVLHPTAFPHPPLTRLQPEMILCCQEVEQK